MRRIAHSFTLILAFLLTFVASLRGARADSATAQALFDQAKKLMAAGKYDEACPKLAESQRLDPGIGTKYNLADCYEKQGKLATAWGLFLEVAAESKAAGQPDREKVARGRAETLKPKLPYLSITVADGATAGLEVKRDDIVVGQAQLDTPIPVDPGKHTVSATAPGKKPWQATVTTTKAGATETVQVPALEDAPAGAPGYASAPQPGMVLLPEGAAPVRMKRRSGVMMGFGITGIVLGSIFSVVGAGASLACAGRDCEGPAFGILGVGLVGLGGGIALTVIGAKKVPVKEPSRASLAPTVLVSPTSATMRWTF